MFISFKWNLVFIIGFLVFASNPDAPSPEEEIQNALTGNWVFTEYQENDSGVYRVFCKAPAQEYAYGMAFYISLNQDISLSR